MAINNTGFPFKFWCQKVLPLTYDNSLSYYEVLCKLTNNLQTVIEHDLEQDEDIESLKGDVFDFNMHLEELKKCIALDYDPNNMYSKGMYCIMNNDLYVCEESTTGEFDRNCWTHTDFGSELSGTNNDISSMDNRVVYVERAVERIDGTIGEIQGDITTINSRIESVITKLAPAYDGTLNYSVGQYCTFLRGFYVCTANTTGEFDIACWASTDVGYNLSTLYSRYESLSVLVNAVTNTLKDVRNISANEYNKTATYNEGDYCTHGWVMYKCNSNNVTGNFDGTYWDETTVGDELILAMNSGGSGGSDIPIWDANVSYELFDCVKYNDNIYMAIDGTPIGTVPTNTSYWVQTESINYFASGLNTVAKVAGLSDGQSFSVGEIYAIWDTNIGGAERVAIARGHQPYTPNQSPYLENTDLVEELNRTNGVLYDKGVSTYDTTKVYNTGDLIVNFWTVKKCLEDNVTGNYDATKWESTDIFTELANLKKLVNDVGFYNETQIDRVSDSVVSQ